MSLSKEIRRKLAEVQQMTQREVVNTYRATHGNSTLLDHWVAMLKEDHDQIDPATESWDRLMSLLGQCEQGTDLMLTATGWIGTIFLLRREVIALEKPGEDRIHVIASSPTLNHLLGPNAIRFYGQKWVARGWVEPGNDGKATYTRSFGRRGTMRTLQIPRNVFENRKQAQTQQSSLASGEKR